MKTAEQRAEEIRSVFGSGREDIAHEIAMEAGQLGLMPSDLEPALRSHHLLAAMHMSLLPGDDFVSWALRHGVVTAEEMDAARELDILCMRPDPEEEK